MIHPEQDPTNREQTLATKKDKTPALQSPAADPAAQQHAFQVRLLYSSGPSQRATNLAQIMSFATVSCCPSTLPFCCSLWSSTTCACADTPPEAVHLAVGAGATARRHGS